MQRLGQLCQMQIKLKSDFREYYDHHFAGSQDKTDLIFDRRSDSGPSKREQLFLLEQLECHPPLHGFVKDIVPKLLQLKPKTLYHNKFIVIYTDEHKHRGEGKICVSINAKQVLENFQDNYCSLFIPSTDNPLEKSISRRLLCIGNRCFWLTYQSPTNWMSNAHDTTITYNCETLNRKNYCNECYAAELIYDLLKPYPMFAIDFVESLVHKKLMAIDFNISPGLKYTGIEDILSAKHVYQLIHDHIFLFNRRK